MHAGVHDGPVMAGPVPCELLQGLGDGEVAEAWDRIEKLRADGPFAPGPARWQAPGIGMALRARHIEQYMHGLESGQAPRAFAELDREWNRTAMLSVVEAGLRQQIQTRIGFATLTSESLSLVKSTARGARIVDVGAGAGHLARVLRAHGLTTIAIDQGASAGYVEHLGGNVIEARARPWLEENLRDNDVPVLCWPPLDRVGYEMDDEDDPGACTLRRLRPGQPLVYIGEDARGCTGTRRFHALLAERFREVAHAPVAPIMGSRTSDELIVLEPIGK